MITGSASSKGIAWGNILILENQDLFKSGEICLCQNTEEETKKLGRSIQKAKDELTRLRAEVAAGIGEKEEMIFEAQELILDDPALIGETRKKIIDGKMFAGDALRKTILDLEEVFETIGDETISQRISDVRDVGARILKHLEMKNLDFINKIPEPAILVAGDLMPSQAAGLDKNKILAVVTERGGINSHASIIARSLGIPAIVGVRGLLKSAKNCRTILVDGFSGAIYMDPQPWMIEKYEKMKADKGSPEACDTGVKARNIKTSDGERIYLYANLGGARESKKVKSCNLDGVGVLRSEFLLSDKDFPPTEKDFFDSFGEILESAFPLPVDMRLLDLGADKRFRCIALPEEVNPALGCRGWRLTKIIPKIIKSQIRGIIKANTRGNARILVPMVTTILEIREINGIIRQIEKELSAENVEIKGGIPIGIMIETPASALLSPIFAQEVDFLSIGTNDLTQYTLASDRDNDDVQDIYNGLNPAVLQLISICVRAAEKEKKKISICGEMAADVRAIPVLLGLGIRHLSVGINRVSEVREIIEKIHIEKAKHLAGKALKSADATDVERLVARFLRKIERLEFGRK